MTRFLAPEIAIKDIQQFLAQKLLDFQIYTGFVTLSSGSVCSRPLGNQQLTCADYDLYGLCKKR
ncbi:hypothetical protein D3C86_1980030 [compost metagenome]